jgi:hypothetical protein
MFFRLSRLFSREDLHEFFLANFVDNREAWVGEMSREKYLARKKVWVRLPELFKMDLDYMSIECDESPIELFKIKDGYHPSVVQMVMAKEINLETFMVFCKYGGPMWSAYDAKLTDVVWEELSLQIKCYMPFLLQKMKSFDYDFVSEARKFLDM